MNESSRPESPPSPTPASLNMHELSVLPDGIVSLTVDIPGSKVVEQAAHGQPERQRRVGDEPAPSRWRTKEFCAYYAVFVLVVPQMARSVIRLSRESHPNYPYFSRRLKPGWLFGWKVDVSDFQWNVFRFKLPVLVFLVLLWVGAAKVYRKRMGDLDVAKRTTFILAFAALLLVGLHGTSLPKMFFLVWVNFCISRLARTTNNGIWTKLCPVITWIFNLHVLFSNEIYDGYKYGSLLPALQFLDDAEWAKGILPRWHINWNITMLRLVSFNMDYYWAATAGTSVPTDDSADTKKELTEKERIKQSHPLEAYSFVNYLAYALYPPLYLAGPILTFNSFYSQLVQPPTITRQQLVRYAVRFVFCLLTMELVLHSMYVVAIKDSSRFGAWQGDTPFELSMIGFWNLIVVWLKLLIPWRFFRLWALLDGMDPPENMVRCMANNYSTLGFWRSWHRSYNLWVVRYLYVPLLRVANSIAARLLVFTFVALWHDLELRLLTWGWVIVLFILPELAAKRAVPFDVYGREWWYRHLAALGGVFNILMMMTANLIGFAIGTEGTKYMWSQIVGSWEGIKFMMIACSCLFVAVHIMFEYREEEKRRGISRRC